MKFFINLFFLLSFPIYILANTLELTKEEQDFIEKNPEIQVGMMPDFTPFSYMIDDKVIGFEHDLLKLISKKTGLQFQKTIGKWTTIYNAFKNKEIDMLTSISYKKEREPFTDYTSPYYHIPIMIFVRDNFGEYPGLESLNGKKVGILKDVFYEKELQEIGTIDLVIFERYDSLTNALVFGKIDALVQNLTNINYLIKKNLYTNLQLVGELKLPNISKEDLRFGVQREKPLLTSILQKALNSITKKEKEKLVNKWIGSIKEYGGGGHIELDENEIAYLDTKTIKYCIDPNWMPFESLNKKNEHIGMGKDYLNLFERMIPIKFKLIPTENWSQSIEYVKQKKCDILALAMKSEKGEKYLNFTTPYLDVPLVVATKLNVPFISEFMELKGKKIGIPKNYAYIEIFKEKFPFLNIVEVENIDDGLDKLNQGKIFAYIGTLGSIGYKFQTKYYGELKIAGEFPYSWKLGIAVNKDEPMLHQILQKVVNNITNTQKMEIFNKWISIKYEKGIDYTLVWKIVSISIFIFLVFGYWNRKITKTNTLLKKAQIEIKGKNKELEQLAITDQLTSLYNRRKTDELLQNEINRSERFNNPFGIAIMDIDYFKKINDTYGHQIGDKVLVEIANILKQYNRKTDFIGRYGGEEFVIICPESEQTGVVKLMETIHKHIEKHNFEHIGKKTVSFGITMYTLGDTIESIIKRADNALYQAKNDGRNKVILN
jgi:polar amino acid transport system substrate-binding protein